MKLPAGAGWRGGALYLILFTQMLDTSVANLALSNIASDLFLDVLHASWIITSFGTGAVISFPLGSMLCRRHSTGAVLGAGCMLFVFASAGCALVSDPAAFIFARFLQGVGSGMAVIASFPIMIGFMGKDNAAFAVALCSSAVALAPVSGPVIGAYVTEHFGWRWLFMINVPLISLGYGVLLAGLTFEKPAVIERIGPRLLTLGLFGLAVALLQFVLDFGEQYSWFAGAPIVAASAASAAAASAFFVFNYFPLYRILNLSLFRTASFAVPTSILVVGNGLIFSSLVFLPLWFRQDRHMPILFAGLIVSVASGVAAVATPLFGKYFPRRLFPFAALASLALTSLSFFMMSRFTIDTPVSYLVASRLVAGAGLALFTTTLITMSLTGLSPAESVDGNAMSIVLRVLSSNVLVALCFTAYRRLSDVAYGQFAADADRVSFLNYAGLSSDSYLNNLFHTAALGQIFTATGIFFAVGLVLLLPFSRKLT